MIITIDGPVATGKSTVAKKLAQEIGFIYFDTGAMYRTLTIGILREEVDIHNADALLHYLDQFDFNVKIKSGQRRYFLGEEDVTLEIRKPEITSHVSKIAALPAVRKALTKIQRDLSVGVNAIFEGRDMGKTVFPDAELKIFLTGRPDVRAQRRFTELRQKFPEDTQDLTLEQAFENLTERDRYDTSREASPLQQAEDAVVIDTSDLSIDEVVFKILEFRDSKRVNET